MGDMNINYFIREPWGGSIINPPYIRSYLRHGKYISFYPLRVHMHTGKADSSTTYDISLRSNKVVTSTSTKVWKI